MVFVVMCGVGEIGLIFLGKYISNKRINLLSDSMNNVIGRYVVIKRGKMVI